MADENVLSRICYGTAEVAGALGKSADALRRQAERNAERGPDGELIARLDLGIVARKRGGRWVYLIPPGLLSPQA